MRDTLLSITAAMLAACTPAAFAGRPLATDDAAVADTGKCQIEAWYEHARNAHAIVVAPACGVAAEWELGADYMRDRMLGQTTRAIGLATKWVPVAGRFTSPLGALNTGLKVSTGRARAPGSGWHANEHTILALATLEATPMLAMHLNLGVTRDANAHASATLLNAALAWSPFERGVLFAEAQVNDRAAIFGGTLRTAGARWWLVKDTLGLDLTASRQAGSGSNTRWGFGFGWYGL
jgi:hypothetical protein